MKQRLSSKSRNKQQGGYTLIELLLYISIVGTLMVVLSLFFGTVSEARLKNQSITEVEQQGAAVMEMITQTVRNATSVTTPTIGATSSSLTLVVPTAGLSPTVFDLSGSGSAILGYNVDGGSTDSGDSNFVNATKFISSATGTITSLSARIGATIGPSPNNKGQMAIYSGTSSLPTTLLAKSGDVVLTANAWNSFSIPSVSVTSGQYYWLAYNTNGTIASHNNLRYHTGTTNQTYYDGEPYGTWLNTWPAGGGTPSNNENSMYATITTSGGAPGTAQIKEGAGAVTALTNSRVVVSGLTFKNLSRSSTLGVIQISFTVSRVNVSNRNEYDYQETFTSSAALRRLN